MTSQYARASLTSLTVAAVFAAIHHVLELGPLGALIALIFVIGGYGALGWFKHSGARAALIVYAMLNVWIVIGFGLLLGFVEHTLILVAAAHGPAALAGITLARHLSGVAMAAAAIWVALKAWRFLASVADARAEGATAMRRPWLAPGVISLLVVGAFAGAYVYMDASSPRIAIFAPTTGPNAVLTQAFVRAAEMAREDLGDDGQRVQLLIVDTTGTPDEARRTIDQAFAMHRIDAVLGGISASGEFTVPHAWDRRIPHICVCSVRTIGDGQYNFTNIPLPEDEATRWVAEAKRRGVTSIAI